MDCICVSGGCHISKDRTRLGYNYEFRDNVYNDNTEL